jgi:hypothetical protein
LAAKYGRTFGYFDGTLPNLYTTDINLIKSIFVKDFDHFVNRRVSPTLKFFSNPAESILCNHFFFKSFSVKRKVFRKMLTIIQDKEWKDVRSSVTPVFTTGKIKLVLFLNVYFSLNGSILPSFVFILDVEDDNRVWQPAGNQISKDSRE